jgi:hypothetical protein
VDAEPAPITIEAPAPPKANAASPDVAAPASETTTPPKSEAAPPTTIVVVPGGNREAGRLVEDSRTASDAEFTPVTSPRSGSATEIGVGAILVSGATPSGVVGAAPYFAREVSPGFVLRPAISIAGTEAAQFRATWTSARVDACWRIPPEAPVQIDLCGGAEIGFAYVASGNGPGSPPEGHTLPTFDLGPTAALRSEVGHDFAVSLRTGAGINAVRGSYVDVTGAGQQAPLVSARFELAVAWLFR